MALISRDLKNLLLFPLISCALYLAFLLAGCDQSATTPSITTTTLPINFPFPQVVTYSFGIKPAISQADLNQAVQTAYFDWLSKYLTTEGAPLNTYRVHRYTAYNFDTVSEGIGWGMLITVLMENETNQTKKYFDGLWRYYQSYLNASGLMAWHINKNGVVLDLESATEADENVAMALLYADKQWGSSGSINYSSEAESLIRIIFSAEVEADTFVLKPGANWGGSSATNPAYFDLAFYKIWERYDSRWSEVSSKCTTIYDYFYNTYQTGLFPDWCTASGERTVSSYDYTYDATQVPLKLVIDFLWNGSSGHYLIKLSNWLKEKTSQDPTAIVDGYRLDGTTIGSYHNAAFVGPFCVAAMVTNEYQSWLNALYQDLVSLQTGGTWGYYQDTLRLISLLIVSGNLPNLF